jgi:chromosomal replication initiation ATPase DnaA
VIETSANRLSSNMRKREGALNRIVAYISITKFPTNSEMVEHVLHDLFSDDQTIEVAREAV